MKKVIFVMFISCFHYNMYAQCAYAVPCNDFYIQTPNYSIVKACSGSNLTSWELQQAYAQTSIYAISSSHIYEGATGSYNCHAYAWHVKEGGNKVWVNNLCYEANNLNNYWNDDSYYVYDYNSQPHVENLKVFYGNDDHTAVTTSDPNVFISKMGSGCLVAHHKDNSPYTEGNFTYYKRAPTLTGPSFLICTSGGQVTVSNDVPAGYTWTCSSNLTPGAANGNSKTFYAANSSVSAEGWVAVNIGTTELVRRNVQVGNPSPSKITATIGANNTLYTEHPYYNDGFARYPGNGDAILQYDWNAPGWDVSINPNVNPADHPNYDVVRFTPNNPGEYVGVFIRARNVCGWGEWKGPVIVTVVKPDGFSNYSATYPNPVSDILTVDLDAAVSAQQQPAAASRTAAADYDLRLYDGQGNLLRNAKTRGGTVQFNVANLPDGIYYLHIYDGVNPKPEIQQIAVEH